MKLHYIVALILFIFAGLSLYQGFQDGEMGRPTWVIAFLVFAPIALFYEKLRRWLMPIVVAFPSNLFVALMLIFVGGMLIRGIIIRDNLEVVGWSSSLIVGCVYLLLQGKERVKHWLNLFPFIGMGILFVVQLFYFFVVEPKKKDVSKPVGELQMPSVSPESTRNSDLQAENNRFYSADQQKVMGILTSEAVKQEMKTAAATGTPPEFLKSLSNFKDYMISKGMTEFAMIDETSSHFQDLFQKHHPGKKPSDLDPEMSQRLIDMIQEFGYEKGRKKFLQTREVGIWAAARFNLLSDNQESITAWVDDVYTSDWADTEYTHDSVSPPPVVSQDPLASDTSMPATLDTPEHGPMTDASIKEPGTVKFDTSPIREKSLTPQRNEPFPNERPDTPSEIQGSLQTILKSQFSKERFERAMSTLERYGPEEGLRRLRAQDPDVAKQIEQSRNREDRESAPSRIGEHE